MSTADPAPRQRSTSRTRRPPTRPTTPLRPPSRTSLRASSTTTPQSTQHNGSHPLDALEPAFGEFSDAIADLESNMMHLALLHESVSRFNDDFAAFLYGLNMSAFCVDFPEAPGPDAVRRFAERQAATAAANHANAGTPRRAGMGRDRDVDATFLTTDTSFVNDPPASARTTKFAPPATASAAKTGSVRGGTRGRGGIPRGGSGSGRGTASTRGSGIGRGRAR